MSLASLATVLSAPLAVAAQPSCSVVGAAGSFTTLQAAIEASPPRATLRVKGTCYGDSTINKSLRIVGQSNSTFGPATLNGSTASASVITVNSGVTVAIDRLIITEGRGTVGGGIDSEGTLTLTNSTITHNETNGGGGIWSDGPLRLKSSTVSGNVGRGGVGGILSCASSGCGPASAHGSLILIDSTIAENRAESSGVGGIGANGSVELINSSVVRNTAANDEAGSASATVRSCSSTLESVKMKPAAKGRVIRCVGVEAGS